MAYLKIDNVRVAGLSAGVPRRVEEDKEVYAKWGGYEDFVCTTGVERRRIVSGGECTSDLCVAAAERLISDLGWAKEEIEAVVLVTQTPDYHLPATACIIQDRLGLPKTCYAMDISLGCSGWVYGLSSLAALMQSGGIKKALLMAGDTPSKTSSPEDKSDYPLFGDAGTVTALEYDESAKPLLFNMCTDGSGADVIIIPDGGYRNEVSEESFTMREEGDGIVRSRLHCKMDGMSVFSFGITKAPRSITELSEHFGIDLGTVDVFSFHQANKFMVEKIRKKLRLPEDKVPYSIKNFGNTSSASIPLTLVTECADILRKGEVRHIACGFGVGLSWGTVYFETNKTVVSELVEL